MKIIEIREKKAGFYINVIGLPILVIGFAYYIFLSGSPQVTTNLRFAFLGLVLYSCYMIFTAVKRRREHRPTLVFSEFSLEVYGDHKTSLYLWQDIKDWKIDVKENTHYLIIETYSAKRSIVIDGLDKRPEEISEIVRAYLR